MNVSWMARGCVLLLAAGCATNPVTGRRQLSLVPEGQEIQMGQQAAVQVSREIGLVPDSTLQRYVQGLGATLGAASERPALPWTFRVVDDPTPNAFALPGGYIFLTRGMLALMNSEAELVTVLGHEIGHVTAKHQVTMMSRAQLAQLGLGLGTVLVPELQNLGGLASGGLQLLFLRYSRDAERQADELGFRYAVAQRYEPREMARVFQSLQRVSETERSRSGRSPLPGYLASHPGEPERIAAVQRRAAQVPAGTATRVERAAYLQRLSGMVYGENPRQGYFQQNVFLHPDLRFSIVFPADWRTQNLPQAVTGMSPRQDAVLQLSLAEQATSAEDAARRFFSQQGVQAGQGGRTTVNGLSATVVYFQAQTQQGILGGIAQFVEHNGRVYQVLAFAPGQMARQYEGVFRQALGSFSPVTDPAVLNIRPNRIRIVRVPQAMTLADFHRRYPSMIPVEELAIINQVAAPTTTIPAGTLLKQVVRE
jgi:predicted Zn-dependent protease